MLRNANSSNVTDISKNEAIVASPSEISNDSNKTNIKPESASTTQFNNSEAKTSNNGKPKSCLSRHNSTHTSIKKRVNISVHTEIIETDPSPTCVLPNRTSAGDEEDDVFSDSLPPPKRESMCAPYLERDIESDDLITETLAYSHGLPEWFNNERINDV